MATEATYAGYVIEEQKLFQDILDLKEDALRSKRVNKANDREIRVWRNQIKTNLHRPEQETIDADITNINYDLRRVAYDSFTIAENDVPAVRNEYHQAQRRIASLKEQLSNLTVKHALNLDTVNGQLTQADFQLTENLRYIRQWKRKIRQSKRLIAKKEKEALDVLDGYATVPVSGLFTADLSIVNGQVQFRLMLDRDKVRDILNQFDAGNYYPQIPFDTVSDWSNDYKENYTERKPIDYLDEIEADLQEAKGLFESPTYWQNVEIAPAQIELPPIPSVEMLKPSEKVGLPASILAELHDYSTGTFDRTTANADRINEIARTYQTPPIEFEQVGSSEANQISKDKIMQLTDVLNQFNRKTTKSGMTINLQSASMRLLKGQDKSFRALNNAYDEFEAEVQQVNNWVAETWYQFGGTPTNDNSYNKRGNAGKWGGKSWY